MPTRSGFIQGYNAQNVTSDDGLIIATELTRTPRHAVVHPMLRHAEDAAALITAAHPRPRHPQPPTRTAASPGSG